MYRIGPTSDVDTNHFPRGDLRVESGFDRSLGNLPETVTLYVDTKHSPTGR